MALKVGGERVVVMAAARAVLMAEEMVGAMAEETMAEEMAGGMVEEVVGVDLVALVDLADSVGEMEAVAIQEASEVMVGGLAARWEAAAVVRVAAVAEQLDDRTDTGQTKLLVFVLPPQYEPSCPAAMH